MNLVKPNGVWKKPVTHSLPLMWAGVQGGAQARVQAGVQRGARIPPRLPPRKLHNVTCDSERSEEASFKFLDEGELSLLFSVKLYFYLILFYLIFVSVSTSQAAP